MILLLCWVRSRLFFPGQFDQESGDNVPCGKVLFETLKEGPQLQLPNTTLGRPLVSKSDYLGVTLSYHTVRFLAANIYFRILRKWLLDRHHPLVVRFCLYNQCALRTVSDGAHDPFQDICILTPDYPENATTSRRR